MSSSRVSPTRDVELSEQPVDANSPLESVEPDDGSISLVIAQQHVGMHSVVLSSADSAQDDATKAPHAIEYVTLLSGSLSDFQDFAGTEHAGWLIDIAHDICDPQHKRGSLCLLSSGRHHTVLRKEPLVSAVYVYSLASDIVAVGLAETSNRVPLSTSRVSRRADPIHCAVTLRDRYVCWLTRLECQGSEVTISHIVPRRLGDWQASHILSVFSAPPLPTVARDIHDPRFCICLQPHQARKFGVYEIGLRHIVDETYVVHVFTRGDVWTAAGPGGAGPLLHGVPITPPTPGHTDNPPPALFRWHYLQCVIKRFGHPDYTADLPNLGSAERLMRMEGDSDDEGTE